MRTLIIFVSIILSLCIYTPIYAYNEDPQFILTTEKIGKCGYIFEFLPDGNIICATLLNKPGKLGAKVKLLDINNNKLVNIANIPDVYVGEAGEKPHNRGLLGLTLDPNFEDNRYVYLHYTYKDGEDGKQYRKIVRFVYDSNNKRLINPVIILNKIPANEEHNGGPLEFGPDGKLYITGGDADREPHDRYRVLNDPEVRNTNSLKGKILRIDRNGNIPEDNPFNNAVYAMGFRNVFGIAFHPITGLPYITDNGPDTGDELNILYKGKDYGWPVVLGYDEPIINKTEYKKYNFKPRNYVRPIWSSGNTSNGPTQLIFYTGNKYKEFKNDILFLTFADGMLNRVKLGNDYKSINKFYVYQLNINGPTDIEVHEGDIYVSNIKGNIYIVKFYKK